MRLINLTLALLLLLGMSQLGVIAIELTLHDLTYQLEEMPPVHPQVTRLMRYHGVQFFDWNEDRQEYGFYRNGQWCPAR